MYVAVKGGERAIENAHALLADARPAATGRWRSSRSSRFQNSLRSRSTA